MFHSEFARAGRVAVLRVWRQALFEILGTAETLHYVIHGVDEAIANVTAAFGDRAPDKATSPAQSERPRRPDAP
jgi:hypothetical protein